MIYTYTIITDLNSLVHLRKILDNSNCTINDIRGVNCNLLLITFFSPTDFPTPAETELKT
jgi:hypothetical protein